MFMPLSIAVYLSFQILKLSDMSLDGGFVLGGAVFARALMMGLSPFASFLCTIVAGMISGGVLAAMQYRNRINDLISGIVLSLMLYSINLNIMERPNLDLGDFRDENGYAMIIYLVCCLLLIVYLFRYSGIGLTLRAFGDNYAMLNRLGVNAEKYRFWGLMISSVLVAGGGAITSSTYGYCNIDMGMGVALTALSTVIIGHRIVSIIPIKNIVYNIVFACLIGSYTYFLILNSLLAFGISPINFKIVTGVIIMTALILAKAR